jgi:hypothetical protein
VPLTIHLTAPDIPETETEKRLLLHWNQLAVYSDATYHLWRPFAGQSHEALLSDIWNDIRRSPPGKYLISDLDFIPFKDALLAIEGDLDKYRAVFVPYFTRDSYGFIKHPFFTALWFWAVNTTDVRLWPPHDWIRTIGRPLDVGAGGFLHLLHSGFARAEEIKFYDGQPSEALDRQGWVTYPDLGHHVFNHRNFADRDTVIEPFGLRVQTHRENIERYLDEC